MVAVRAARSHDRYAFGRGTATSYFRIVDALGWVVMRPRGQRRMLYSALAPRARAVAHLHVARIRELPHRRPSRRRDVRIFPYRRPQKRVHLIECETHRGFHTS